MNLAAIKKTEIVKELSLIPDEKLDSVRTCIDAILMESQQLIKSGRSLKGIWSNKGFEKIIDLEGELKKARKESDDAILKKQF